MAQERTHSTLMVECLEHILSYLRRGQLPTLVSLLRVNKTFFQLTVPILYQNPFLTVLHHRSFSPTEKTERHVQLFQLFLSELDPKLRAELPPCQVKDEDEDEDEAYSDISQEESSKGDNMIPSYATQIGMGGYFNYYRIHDHSYATTKAVIHLFGPQRLWILQKLDEIFLRHCGRQVLSLCLSSMEAHRSMEYIPLLPNLKRLEIHYVADIDASSLEALVEWIQAHNNTHGSLRELQIGGESDLTNHQEELIQLPLAFKNLRVLDTKSWSKGWFMANQLPVESLESLTMDYGEAEVPEDGSKFMLRCQSLKFLDILVPAPDTFQVASNLFKIRHHHWTPDEAEGLPVEALDVSAAPGMDLPPIERLYISGNHQNLRNALEDAPVALSQSLRALKATSLGRQEVLTPSLTWGRPLEVEIPFLRELHLQGDIALEFHFDLLQCCPNLAVLMLQVNGLDSCGREGNPIERILSLKKLQILQLWGRWPLTASFVQRIPSHLTGLRMLDLEGCTGVELDEVMEAVHGLEFLWRVGWYMDDSANSEELLARWSTRAPNIRIGQISRNEFFA
ncbi:hypothetical protein B0O80DRAFT_462445 [Mortierella sp. GBAus27b]|nr:hypothetical protein BGX31_005354 [Mortierella sp. GBA43]KAI8348513.1 hypothetical protein B0O80DRAFT_462445 [Mortierella sp. GBAus27b]